MEVIGRRLHATRFVCITFLLLVTVAHSFYLPGVAPQDFVKEIRRENYSLVNGNTERELVAQKEIEEEWEEPILMEQPQKYCMYPIEYPQLWEMYKKAQASFWTAEEVDLSQDVQQWETLSLHEKHFITHVLAFFAASDGIFLENLAARFLNDVQIAEARAFYGFQTAMENIHSEQQGLLAKRIAQNSKQQEFLQEQPDISKISELREAYRICYFSLICCEVGIENALFVFIWLTIFHDVNEILIIVTCLNFDEVGWSSLFADLYISFEILCNCELVQSYIAF